MAGMGGNIYRSSVMQAAINSKNTEFFNDADTSFAAEVPTPTYIPDQPLADGSINIRDTAIMATVIGSEDTVIDSRGTKTRIKIPEARDDDDDDEPVVCHPESETTIIGGGRPSRANSGFSANNSVVLNAVSSSSDTKVDMSGARIRIKRKNRPRKDKPGTQQAGGINLENTAAVGLVVNSQRTELNLRDADIKIE